MSELLVDFITSLDGYGAAEGWPGWWGLEGPEYLAWLNEQLDANETVLMGANTYRLMSGFAADGEPGTDVLAGLNKVVFSTTLTEPLAWANTKLVARDAVEAVREMKSDGSSPMRTMGSLAVCRALLKAGLVDRFRVVVFPVITGSTGQDRIYDGYPDVALEMISSRTFDARTSAPRVRPHASRRTARRGSWWSTVSELWGIARFKFHEGQLEEFKRLSAQAMEIVRTKEPGTLQYDIYFNDDQSECVVLERYRDSEAAMAHAANLGDLFGAVLATVTVVHGELLGEPSAELRAKLADTEVPVLFTPYQSMEPKET